MSRLSSASRRILLAVLALTALGFALRLARYEQSFFGDESSTLYLTDGRSLFDVISLVSSDAEITPPLYFVLAWLSEQARIGARAGPAPVADRRHRLRSRSSICSAPG